MDLVTNRFHSFNKTTLRSLSMADEKGNEMVSILAVRNIVVNITFNVEY